MDSSFYKQYFDENRPSIEKAYADFLRFPTISSDPLSRPHMESCVQWLINRLKRSGCYVEEWKSDGPSIVFASSTAHHQQVPTVLIYNHYDVQPVDPITEWQNNPFEPRIEGDTFFARGAQDNKGQCFFVLLALEALTKLNRIPCHLKFIIEGEEENGSASLIKMISNKRKELSADYTMVIDAGMLQSNIPAINLGTRGVTALTLIIKGTNQDVHSGSAGGLAYNPLHAMVYLLASLRNADGSIAVPHFYDAVRMPSEHELACLATTFDAKAWEFTFGQPPTGGESAFSPLIRNWLRPTLEINGIHGGYGGSGCKTVIPKEAIAKITCRLVPEQDPMTIAILIRDFLLSKGPKGVTLDITIHEGAGKAMRTSPHSPGIQALKEGLKTVWQTEPEFILSGGSIPIIPLLQEISGGEIITWGVGLPTDHIHAPNERFDLTRMQQGFISLCLTLELLAKGVK